jgi:MbtH protein
MTNSEIEDHAYIEQFRVVINIEDQYSIWPIRKEIPYGWSDVGISGSKEECLAYIKEVWTDMRPRSLKEQMAKTEEHNS